ncbi:Uncharacterised protein [Vibrio cholerae]|nr:Uncharacterised protein [Vibrio cholerae]
MLFIMKMDVTSDPMKVSFYGFFCIVSSLVY